MAQVAGGLRAEKVHLGTFTGAVGLQCASQFSMSMATLRDYCRGPTLVTWQVKRFADFKCLHLTFASHARCGSFSVMLLKHFPAPFSRVT